MESPIITVFFLFGAGLLVVVTGGIIYLTAAEWRDRRRRDQEKRSR